MGTFDQGCRAVAREEASLLADFAGSGPIRVLLISPDYTAARQIDGLLHMAWTRAHLVTHAEWDSAAAEALLDHPACCVLLDVAPRDEDPLTLLEHVRTAAPDVPIVLLCDREDEVQARRALTAGAQDCVVKSELEPALLRRTLTYAMERKRADAQVAHQALHDPLTGLPNRALFLDRLGVALERARRSGAQLAVLFLDFDNFKQINDSRGHAAGDRLLATLGERLSAMLRPMDTVARFGGDEFTFLFEDLTSEREVVLIAERICDAVSLPVLVEGHELVATVSVGIAMVADPSVAPETVIREADAAMYRAKERGRACYELFDEDSRQRAVQRIELEAELSHAVERAELRVHYLPSISLNDHADVAAVEALVRWQHPHRGLIAPRDFIPMAEDTGMVLPIGRFVLEHALDQLATWREHRPEMTMSLNLSSRELHDANLPSLLSNALRAHELDPGAVTLEVPESALAREPGGAIRNLERLKATGVRIAIDDFGSGASSLAVLRELPIDALKIHESFISTVGDSPEDASVVAALVELGHALGCSVVAEGVETEAQLEQLRELGCDGAQGFVIGRPVTDTEVQALLTTPVA
jgi:diguanylate cyclase (GGDEF)-like protein